MNMTQKIAISMTDLTFESIEQYRKEQNQSRSEAIEELIRKSLFAKGTFPLTLSAVVSESSSHLQSTGQSSAWDF